MAGKIRNFFTKLQNLPDSKKKIILFTIVGATAMVMGFFWVREAKDNLFKLGAEVKKVKIPTYNMPKIPTEALQRIEAQIQQISTPTGGINNK
jgi:hypothetical protein